VGWLQACPPKLVTVSSAARWTKELGAPRDFTHLEAVEQHKLDQVDPQIQEMTPTLSNQETPQKSLAFPVPLRRTLSHTAPQVAGL